MLILSVGIARIKAVIGDEEKQESGVRSQKPEDKAEAAFTDSLFFHSGS
jgi:hypothetical protein